MRLFLAAAVLVACQVFSVAVAQTPMMVPSTCVGTFSLLQPMVTAARGPMTACSTSGGPPPSCSNSLDFTKTCNSVNIDLL